MELPALDRARELPQNMLRVCLFEPPARTSNESDVFRALPDTELTVVSDRGGWGADVEVVLPASRVPWFGSHEGWTAAPAWLRNIGDLQIVADVFVSLELFSFSSWQAGRLAERTGTPHVVWIAETLPDMQVYRLPPWRQIAARTRTTAASFLCMTDRARRHAIDLGCDPSRCETLYPGVDVDVFTPRPAGRSRDPIVLFVGMLRADRGANKGLAALVQAGDLLAKRFDRFRLRLVGDGHLRHDLEVKARSREWLEVTGPVDRAAVPQLMQEARVLALPSQRTWKWEEQFGFVLIEAMATGLPVVGTRSGAIPEIVPPWNPLVDEGDASGLAEGLARALGPDGELWGIRNRRVVETDFALPIQAQKLAGALHRAARPSPPASLRRRR